MGTTLGTSQATGTILNPNIPPQISIGDAAVIASTSGTIGASFTVSLSAPSAQTVTVVYATSDGTGKAGVDYVAVPPATLTFIAAGSTQQSVTVTVNSERPRPRPELRRQSFSAQRRGRSPPRSGWAWARSSLPGPSPPSRSAPRT